MSLADSAPSRTGRSGTGGLAGDRAGWGGASPGPSFLPSGKGCPCGPWGWSRPSPQGPQRPGGQKGSFLQHQTRGSDVSHCRKCKLVTSGPWLEVAPLALADVSIIPESPGANRSGHSIALWAISDKGDVLCRLGVSELNPAVSTLPHLPALGPFWGFWRILRKIELWTKVRLGSGLQGPAQDSPGDRRPQDVALGVTRFPGQWELRLRLA